MLIVTIVSCVQDDMETGEQSFETLDLRVEFPESRNIFKENPKISELTTLLNKKHKSNLIHASLYGIYVDTSQVQMITAPNYTSFSFKVERDTIVQDTLYNYIITKYNNEDYQQMLMAYPVIPDEDNNDVTFDVANARGTLINDPTLQLKTGGCAEYIEEIWEWDPNAGDCVDVNCTAGGNHSPGEASDCDGGPGQLPYTTCTGGWVVTGCAGSGGGNTNGDTNDQGGGGGDGTNNDTEEEEETTPVAIIPFNNLSRKCKKVSDFLDENTGFKTLLQGLDNLTDVDYEVSISKFKNEETIITDQGVPGGDPKVRLLRNPTQKYEAYAHTHYEDPNTPEGDTYSVFSIDDLFATAQLIDDGDVNTSSFVMFLVTGKETYYALTISNKTKYLKFFKTILHPDIPTDPSLLMQWVDARTNYEDLYDKYYDEEVGLIKASNTDKNLDLNHFLNFLKDADIATELFKSNNASFSNITKVELGSNNEVVSRSCNQNRK